MVYDYLIVGAGLSGTMLARNLAESDFKILLLEKNNHIDGCCYDETDAQGIVVHRYGAHIVHTNFKDVWQFLSRFTKWRDYEHEVLCCVDGSYIPIPFNFHSLIKVFNGRALPIQDMLIQKYRWKTKISILDLMNSKETLLKDVGDYIYQKIFKNYTIKQWGMEPYEISTEVIRRVPVYTDYDNRYFTDTYQGIPQDGYTPMTQAMLLHPNIELRLQTSFESVCVFEDGKITLQGRPFDGMLIYTGPLDKLFQYKFGYLPYRSLKFEFESLKTDHYQPKAVINYPNDYDYTRIIEFKHLTGQQCRGTAICREYPQAFEPTVNEPFYSLMTTRSRQAYDAYATEAKRFDNLILAGRLADFRYYDMDDAVNNALDLAGTLTS